ncbi:DUF2018 family protein [Hydrogenimonas urashimensis]|uniref:DUF2018 family protein n=1 Tax=Hydrogenimonas urashimensis TaxID=2740515 RepID=UPI001915F17E|nr:DUF2018 family protein [Hydrogenimonas urashimensis]
MLFEDEEDIFTGGSPKRKFFDIVYHANRNLVENEIDKLVMRLCIVESMLEEKIGEEALENEVRRHSALPSEELEDCMASKYIGLTADILTQNE